MKTYQLRTPAGDVLVTSPTPLTYSAAQRAWVAPDGTAYFGGADLALYVHTTQMSVVRFKAQFPFKAQLAIELARAYVPADPAAPDLDKLKAKAALDLLFGTLADLNQAGSLVDVADPAVVVGLDQLVAMTFIDAPTADGIKGGIVQPVA